MKLHKIGFVLFAGMLFSCNSKNNTVENTKDTTMTTTLELEHGTRIKGPAGSLFVDDGGTGGIPVVFLHSFGGSTEHWEKQLAHLRKKRRAVAFDFRGHGKSDLPMDSNYSTQSIAEDLKSVIDSLGIDRFILVGHSMGGASAITYVSIEPERVAGLVLVGAPGKTPAAQAEPIIASLESDQYEKVMDDYMKSLLVDAKPGVDSLVLKGSKQISKEASLLIIKEIFAYDPLPLLQRYPGPKLIVATTREAEQPNALFKQLGDVPYKTVGGTSHWVQLDKPEEFNKILDEFIDRVEKKNN
jgi:pimeloyl-ACP methyl ester carboxylesterase